MSEIDRLVALGDANAVLDELQQRRTEWDDAREALDRLISGSAQVQKSDELLVQAHNDLCKALDVRRVTLAGAIQAAATIRAQRDAAHHDLRLCVGVHFTTVTSAAVEAVRRVAAAEDDRDRLAEENDSLRSDVEAAKRGWRKNVATVERVRAWVNGDVVTAISEFGSGYREAMRDVRDLLAARDAKEETRG